MTDTTENLTIEYTLKDDECPCGSGKSPEKCCGFVKSRTYTAELDYKNYLESDGIAIGLDRTLKRIKDGERLPIIGDVKFSQSHSRESKLPKIIIKGIPGNEYIMDPNSILFGCDSIFAIDTNTRDIEGHTISMTGVVHAFIKGDELKYAPITILEFRDPEVNPELLGWYAVIKSIKESADFADKNIAIIVDAHLDDLDAYNNKSKPILGDSYLPIGITLLYASADKGTSVGNKLIKLSDRIARDQLGKTGVLSDVETLKETPYPCKYFRQWLQ